MLTLHTIIISRTDSIGDVVLTLPLAGALRALYPKSRIIFLGQTYTSPVIKACAHVDEFLNWDELRIKNKNEQVSLLTSLNADAIFHVFPRREIAILAKLADIPYRIGTSRRWYHFFSCNKTISFTRKGSRLHEAQLNMKLLGALDQSRHYELNEIAGMYGLDKIKPFPSEWAAGLSKEKFNLVLHPKSKGSAKEWGIENFEKLINLLPEDKFNLLITGTKEEGALLTGKLPFEKPNVQDLTGRLSLEELISLLSEVDGIVAASTGPLHIASALGKHAIGLYAPMRPIHPGRWAPVGPFAKNFVFDETCQTCKKRKDCDCIKRIAPETIAEYLKTISDA